MERVLLCGAHRLSSSRWVVRGPYLLDPHSQPGQRQQATNGRAGHAWDPLLFPTERATPIEHDPEEPAPSCPGCADTLTNRGVVRSILGRRIHLASSAPACMHLGEACAAWKGFFSGCYRL